MKNWKKAIASLLLLLRLSALPHAVPATQVAARTPARRRLASWLWALRAASVPPTRRDIQKAFEDAGL